MRKRHKVLQKYIKIYNFLFIFWSSLNRVSSDLPMLCTTRNRNRGHTQKGGYWRCAPNISEIFTSPGLGEHSSEAEYTLLMETEKINIFLLILNMPWTRWKNVYVKVINNFFCLIWLFAIKFYFSPKLVSVIKSFIVIATFFWHKYLYTVVNTNSKI